MYERLKFIARLLDGDKMSALCREFGISRKTGYKILKRYNACGLHGLTDRSWRPYRQANQLPVQIEKQIVRLKRERPPGALRRTKRPAESQAPEMAERASVACSGAYSYSICWYRSIQRVLRHIGEQFWL
jgi:transposase